MSVESSINRGISVVLEAVKYMPLSPGIYKMVDAANEIVYVGKAKNLPKRVASYSNISALPHRLKRMLAILMRIDYLTTQTEAEALLLEAHLIKSLKPRFNILLKDDKSFPYIAIEENHEYPRIAKFRGKKSDLHTYFGPFAQAKSVNAMIIELQKLFLVRPCSDNFFHSRSRPCLQYQIKRCSAPCMNKISIPDYGKSIQQVKELLSGKNSEIRANLVKEMELASNQLNYEKAAEIRDRIRLLSEIQAKNNCRINDVEDADFIALYRDDSGCAIQVIFIRNGINYGDKVYFPKHIEELNDTEIMELFIGQIYQNNQPAKNIITSIEVISSQIIQQALSKIWGVKSQIFIGNNKEHRHLLHFAQLNAKEALERQNKDKARQMHTLKSIAQLFGLSAIPKRIEVYDNSHIQGTNAVGCMIVVGVDGFIKNQYRKFIIKSTEGIGQGDDYQMMREVFERRLRKLTPENTPDIILIDGGKGHLMIADEVIRKLNIIGIKLVAISKGPDRNAGREFFHTLDQPAFQLDKHDPNLHYLQYIRDEVHRFAITAHRAMRTKNTMKSGVDDIPLIGEKRKKLLLSHFGSLERLKATNIEDIMRIKGINNKIATIIYNYLHNQHRLDQK